MCEILITGATDNVGRELIKIFSRAAVGRAVAAVSNFAKYANRFSADIESHEFNFIRPETFSVAMRGVDKVFLMRPPAISNVRGDIFPLLSFCSRANVSQIVLLSLLGAENYGLRRTEKSNSKFCSSDCRTLSCVQVFLCKIFIVIFRSRLSRR